MAEEKSIEQITAEGTEARIADALEDLVVDIDSLHVHPENPRRGDVPALASSLTRFGQVRPILALPDGTVIAGNHLLLAARSLGWAKIAAVKEDLDEETARAYLAADNKLAALGGFDQAALGSLLEQINSEEALRGTGYGEDEVAKLLAKLDPAAPSEFEEFDGDVETDRVCPSCGFSWSSGEK